jgi:hypothetical protein
MAPGSWRWTWSYSVRSWRAFWQWVRRRLIEAAARNKSDSELCEMGSHPEGFIKPRPLVVREGKGLRVNFPWQEIFDGTPGGVWATSSD